MNFGVVGQFPIIRRLNRTVLNSTPMTESKDLACAFALLVLASGLAACRHGDTAHHTDALIVCPGVERVSFLAWEQIAMRKALNR